MFMSGLWTRLWHEERGQNLAEYPLLLTLACLVSISAFSTFGTHLRATYSRAGSTVVAFSASGSTSSSASDSKTGKKPRAKKSGWEKSKKK